MSSVLVLDDRDADRDLLSTVLGYAGHTVLPARSGPEALEIARARCPDLIITDIVMPTMNGYEFVRALREEAEIGATPVVFTTANYVQGEILELARACGVSRFIPKPCEPGDLVRLVGEALAESDGSAEPIGRADFDSAQLRVLNDKLVEKTDALEGAAAERQRLVAELIDTQERELARVADLVHDEPIQALAAVGIRLDMLAKAVGDPHAEAVTRVRSGVTEAAARLRALLGELQGLELEERSFGAALGDLVERTRLEGRIAVKLADHSFREPSHGAAILLYRCAREALMNVRKHAGATHAGVTLNADDAGFLLRVEDDGRGLVPREAMRVRRGHLGLPSMRERLQAAGGSLMLESESGQGTVITVTMPDAA